jgi:hypothetical protein
MEERRRDAEGLSVLTFLGTGDRLREFKAA